MAPRDELAAAVVPEGTAPGAEFAVPVCGAQAPWRGSAGVEELLAGVGQLANHSSTQ